VPTGDELVEPDQPPGPGQIRNSNAAMLLALCRQVPAAVEVGPIARDDREQHLASFREGLKADVLLVTGGVSAGRRDLVPAVLGELGVETIFHGVRVKPGKPLLFGVGPDRPVGRPGTLVFGLPGNPVSSLVGFLLFVRPALLVLAGRSRPDDPRAPSCALAAPFSHRGERATYHPARRLGDRLEPLKWLGSADLHALAAADGFAVFPPGDRDYQAGDRVGYLPIPNEFVETDPTLPARFS
jgi:molybdopterin molybdotransferase